MMGVAHAGVVRLLTWGTRENVAGGNAAEGCATAGSFPRWVQADRPSLPFLGDLEFEVPEGRVHV